MFPHFLSEKYNAVIFRKVFLRFTVLHLVGYLLVNYPGIAQDQRIIFEHYTVKDGLINNLVEYVHIDREGFAWFAFLTGLQQFDGYRYRTFLPDPTDSNSMSGNFITTIFEDSEGELWIGTLRHGVNRFNKREEIFHNYRFNLNSGSNISGNIIPRGKKSIIQDRNGFVWVNTENGLNRIDKTSGAIEHFFGDLRGQMVYDSIGHVLWIADKHLKKFDIDNGRITYYDIPLNNNLGGTIQSVLYDDDYNLWLGTNYGIVIFNTRKSNFLTISEYFINSSESKHLRPEWASLDITSIYQDYQGFFWIASGKSVYRIDISKNSFQKYQHEIDNLNSLRDEQITGIYGNGNGIIWLTYLNKGISKVNIKTKKFTSYEHNPNDPYSISGNTVRSIYKDAKGHLWIGTYNNGLNRIFKEDGEKKILRYRYAPDNLNSLSSDYITAIYVDSRERLWIGTYEKGLCYADHIYQSEKLIFERFATDAIFEIHEFTEDESGKIWISTQMGFYVYDPRQNIINWYGDRKYELSELKNINIQSVIIEPPNIFWLATWNSGLCKLYLNSDRHLSPEIGKDSLYRFTGWSNSSYPASDIGFVTIFKDKEKNIWLGTNGNGLIKVVNDQGQNHFFKYDRGVGAPDNSVFGIAGDKMGNIWISTGYGIGKFNPSNELFQNYYESDGLLSNVFIWDASYQHHDGEIFFGNVNGLNSFYPDSIKDFNSNPKIFISNLIIHNQQIEVRQQVSNRILLHQNIRYTHSITLTHKEPVFSLEFIAIDNFNTDQIQYAYMLEGFDNDWTLTNSERRFASYTNLDPDTYVFRVKSTNRDGVWNSQEASLEIVIIPPIWKTWWAYAGYILIFLILLYLLQIQIINMTRLKHSLQLEQIKHERDNELAQMKINFFTNLSHEIRTPLTLILGPIERILKANDGGVKMQQQVRIIQKNANRLLKLTNQLLNFKNMKFDKMRIRAAKGNIVKFTKEILIAFKQQAKIKNIDLNFSSDEKQIELWYDRDKMEVVLYNIISNAFKFTPKGGQIKISISKNMADEEMLTKHAGNWSHASHGLLPDSCTEYVDISVKDSGAGISPRHIDLIFQRYFRAVKHEKTKEEGYGIGLEQARNIVKAHQGTISLYSREGDGSDFIVRLPIGREHLKENEVIHDFKNSEHEDHYRLPDESIGSEGVMKSNDHIADGRKIIKGEILIIDDNPDIIRFLNEALKNEFEVLVAFDGQTGYDMANEKIPDLIISDIMMPGMDGMELCRKLKSDVRTSHIPIFLLTARTSLLYELEGFEMGADDYITKPFNERTLKARIRNVLTTRKKLGERLRRENAIQPVELAITTPDERFLKQLMRIIEENIADPELNVEKLTREMGMSHSLIYKKLVSLTDLNIVEFIRTVRLNAAAQLLTKTKLQVTEVSAEVGFTDPKYFSKCFQRQFHKTPSEFISEFHNPQL